MKQGVAPAMLTERLEIRPSSVADRRTFLDLFADPEFMVYSGVLTTQQAEVRFDHMLRMVERYPFAKQTIVETATQTIIGYVGVDATDFEGEERLEFGWRLVPSARGQGYATEAASALLGVADETGTGEILAFIDPRNAASQRVAKKVGFAYSRQGTIDGFVDNVYVRGLGAHPTARVEPGELTIALAENGDVDELADLRVRWATQSESVADSQFREQFRAWFEAELGHRTFWLARLDGRAVGMVNVSVFDRMPSPNGDSSRWGYLGNMFVDDPVRNRSVGAQMLNAAQEWADEQELVRLVLNPSERSVSFYKRHGFVDADNLLVRPLSGPS